jgi:osmotically-inducible protein OsmY
MINRSLAIVVIALLSTALLQGCSKEIIGGAAVGAAGVGAAYEYQNKKQMDRLEEDFKAGRITKEEYLERKEDIKSGSIIY